MSDSFTEVTETSWFGRLGNAFKGILFGLALVVGGIVLLFWNEGRTVKMYKALKEGAGAVVSVSPDKVDASLNGKLVHMTGEATTTETLQDPEFAISVQGLKLKRSVQMYQWEEESETKTEKKVGGGETKTTTYTYKKVWTERTIDSSSFKKPQGHENPGSMPYQSKYFVAKKITVGAFTLSPSLVGEINNFAPMNVTELPKNLPATLKNKLITSAGGYYLKSAADSSPGSPVVGDCKISFSKVLPCTVSLFAKQNQSSFTAYQTSVGQSIERLDVGSYTAAQMFEQAQSENTILSWILRLVGLVMLFIGYSLIFKPLSVVLDVLPFLGNIAEMGFALVSGLLAIITGFGVIAVAWLFFRPILAACLFAVAAAGLFFLFRLKKNKGTPPPPPMAPPA